VLDNIFLMHSANRWCKNAIANAVGLNLSLDALLSQACKVQIRPLSQAHKKCPGGSFLTVQAREANSRHPRSVTPPSSSFHARLWQIGKQRESKEGARVEMAVAREAPPQPRRSEKGHVAQLISSISWSRESATYCC
jgi:hypothetical protein